MPSDPDTGLAGETRDGGCRPRADDGSLFDLAQCWADLLLELDPQGRVVSATGAVEALTSYAPSDLIGQSFSVLDPSSDPTVAAHRLTLPTSHGQRIESIAVRLPGTGNAGRSEATFGYRVREPNGHVLVALRRAGGAHPARLAPSLERDGPSGLHEAQGVVVALSRVLNSDRLSDHRLTLFIAEGCETRGNTENSRGAQALAAVGALLRAHSRHGDAAGRLAAERFVVLHDPALDLDQVSGTLTALLTSACPRQRVVVHRGSVDLPRHSRESHLATALAYVIERCSRMAGDDLGHEDLDRVLSVLVGEAVAAAVAMRRAIDGGDFDLAFQPILDVRSGAIHHYEALARFRGRPGEGTPYDLITFAEHTGLITEFDLAMVRKVIAWLDDTRARTATTVDVAVNVSGVSVGSLPCLAGLEALLRDNPGARGRLMFEITESARMTQLDLANAVLQRLRQRGYPVCLDDFGAGAADFEYLSRLEVDIVKLDGTAIGNARREHKGKAFLTALVGLCRDLSVATVAEMIEDEAALDFVRGCGVQYVQGYLFGRPSAEISVFANTAPVVPAHGTGAG